MQLVSIWVVSVFAYALQMSGSLFLLQLTEWMESAAEAGLIIRNHKSHSTSLRTMDMLRISGMSKSAVLSVG